MGFTCSKTSKKKVQYASWRSSFFYQDAKGTKPPKVDVELLE